MSAFDERSADKVLPVKLTSALDSDSVDVIIEDFEKFSAIPIETHHMKASGQSIYMWSCGENINIRI